MAALLETFQLVERRTFDDLVLQLVVLGLPELVHFPVFLVVSFWIWKYQRRKKVYAILDGQQQNELVWLLPETF